jgi:hypothetical protein
MRVILLLAALVLPGAADTRLPVRDPAGDAVERHWALYQALQEAEDCLTPQ